MVHDAPDDISWISEPRMLGLCGLPRSTRQSWERAGLNVGDAGGAYGEGAVLEIALLVIIREHLGLDEIIGAWRDLTSSGVAAELINHARCLREQDRFDLVLEPEHAGIRVARTNAELVAAVRHPGAPRPVVVVDIAERIRLVRESFRRLATHGSRPQVKRPGRPRSKVTPIREGISS
jgi:hypothetical protein